MHRIMNIEMFKQGDTSVPDISYAGAGIELATHRFAGIGDRSLIYSARGHQ
jgi:hypothetical protein